MLEMPPQMICQTGLISPGNAQSRRLHNLVHWISTLQCKYPKCVDLYKVGHQTSRVVDIESIPLWYQKVWQKMSEQSGTAGSYGPGAGKLPPTRRRRRRLLGIIATLIAILLIILVLLFFFPRPTAAVTLP